VYSILECVACMVWGTHFPLARGGGGRHTPSYPMRLVEIAQMITYMHGERLHMYKVVLAGRKVSKRAVEKFAWAGMREPSYWLLIDDSLCSRLGVTTFLLGIVNSGLAWRCR
jgi:hypothetical protein